MKTECDVKIAGNSTVADWEEFRDKLKYGKEPENWKLAYEAFFLTRLETRYFEPIRLLIRHGDNVGEGFSIVTLQCSLIEFLASTLEGKSYKYIHPDAVDEKCGEHEYSTPTRMFTSFLRSAVPFKNYFKSDSASDFYKYVRSPLLHEARTKGGWKILAGDSSHPPIDIKKRIVYRNSLHSAFEEFVEWYGENLPRSEEFQRAFIRKFDGLCQE